MKKLFLLFFLIFFSIIPLFANELNVIDLSKSKWEYRWGDSPFENAIPLWTKDKEASKEWKEITYPSNPPNRNGKTNIWYRVKLPDTLTLDPHFYVYSMDIIPEVYFEGKKIYHFGKLNENGIGKYAGWPWHMFSLPPDSAGKYLYFRIYSNYLDIGLFGEILIASKGYIIERFLDHDIPKIMVSSVSIFVAVIFLLSFLSKFVRVELFILGSLFFTQGLNILFSVKVIELYFFFPLLNEYILAVCFFYFPVGMAIYLDRTIKYKVPFNLIRRIWQIHLVYILGAIIGSYFGFYEIPSTYEYFDILYYFITLPILTIFMIYYFFKGDNEVKLITSSFLIISLYWVYSYLIAYQILPWVEYPSDIAVFLCLLLLSYSIVKNLNYTIELEEEKEELTVLSSTDYLTKLYNRKEIDVLLKNNENLFKRYKDIFSIILLDIDDFKNINDTHGHLVGDKFLIEIGNILTKFTRETDFVGRWGGEEFLIICSKTNKAEALKLAENLRNTIDKYQFDLVGHKTASFGVSTYMENDSLPNLLSRADDSMYLSKFEGKNRVRFK
ncbi:MAG: diguanylate cyclase [Arcobacter sp.]|nr:MAG: diguanylate cyclase [Arcobacter sp.]